MGLNLQDDTGTVSNANAYISVAEFKTYHDDRGNDYSAATDPDIEKAIIRATDYLDQRFNFVGEPMNGRRQKTSWPRLSAFDIDNNSVVGIPDEVKEAVAEYAFREATGVTLNPDPEVDPAGTIQSKTETVDVISESITYAPGSGPAKAMPKYPAADLKLRRSGLIVMGGRMIRG